MRQLSPAFLRTIMLTGMLGFAGPGLAADQETVSGISVTKELAGVLDCVSRMDAQTTWEQCRRLMFLPCEAHTVGSEPHLSCLTGEKQQWNELKDGLQQTLTKKLTPGGSAMLTDLTGQWFGYVGQKCGEVAQAKADISADAARTGCEISEIVGISAEFQACLDGRSTSPYCTIQE